MAKGGERETGREVGGGGAGVGWEEYVDSLASDGITKDKERDIGLVVRGAFYTLSLMVMSAFCTIVSLTQRSVVSCASIVGEAGVNKALSALVGIVVGALVYSRGQ
jgi:hypothetical protein